MAVEFALSADKAVEKDVNMVFLNFGVAQMARPVVW
jgi:hypothetical protein